MGKACEKTLVVLEIRIERTIARNTAAARYISAILGLSYEYRDFTITAYLDHGFLATSTGIDVLRVLENAQNSANNSNAREINVKIPNGTNVAYMLSVAYRIGSLRNK